jgi:hypothetical protein
LGGIEIDLLEVGIIIITSSRADWSHDKDSHYAAALGARGALKFKGLKIQILLGLGCKFDDGRDGIIPFG